MFIYNFQVLDPTKRLGCPEVGGFGPLKNHPFFEGIIWDQLWEQDPPDLLPYLPATPSNPSMWSNYRVCHLVLLLFGYWMN